MRGYSKMKSIGTSRSNSAHFTDFVSVPQTTKSHITSPNPTFKAQESEESNKIKNPETNNTNIIQYAFMEQEAEDGVNKGESFGVKLQRNSSISSPSTSSSSLQIAVKRAFSMRRSCSVSESYCRIHDQSVTLASPFDDQVDTLETTKSVKKKKKHTRGKILEACKRLFGM
ncbi:hypothetical protein CFOL_v3_06787 [Cephalotus follicularis]|uniref:Uncharacterized protein n=1 Tax=Cephalotus follicularis TaxID=3775 RepID=A0A1Q3B5H9_CEPFO|nr:hypothetical protein CFOL_v3_06787 [Cephalotus follicularis]